MLHKRLMATGAALILLAALLAIPASAHGGHHSKTQRTVVKSCAVCTTEGCTMIGRHVHDGVTYCGSSHANGVCDGSCVAPCTVEGCTVAGTENHVRDAYCGSKLECGVFVAN